MPISATMPLIKATIFLISSWANRIAPSMTSSETSFAPASTISTASEVPATVRFSRLSARWATVGFTTYASFT